MRAIPTFYDGIEYRSRLEAKWAAFFDQLGWEFTYEPFDGDYYIPDFVIHGRTDSHRNVPWVSSSLVVEIKNAVDLADYWRAVPKVADGLGDDSRYGVVLFGVSPKYFPVGFSDWMDRAPYGGRLLSGVGVPSVAAWLSPLAQSSLVR
jgi:hypothetical protein